MREILVGNRVPEAYLSRLDGENIVRVRTSQLFANIKAVVLGMPGAFTPVCGKTHVVDFVGNALKLRNAGYDALICIVPNDPFVVAAWASVVDAGGAIQFYADGNLDFTRAIGLARLHRDLHLGERSERYMMIVNNGIVERVRVEHSILSVACTRAQDALNEAQPAQIFVA